jgi:transposase
MVTEQVTCVVMEATDDYWKPFYYLLEDLPGVEVVLVNARHVKNLPGRKTDAADATWLAQLGAHGLVRGSFVPPEPIRQLRDLTRTRTAIPRERSREIQRLEKLLENAGINLSSVATDIVGVSGRAMIEAPISGDRDAGRMADLAQRRMRVKIPQPTEALVGRFNEHHAVLARVHLDLIDQHTVVIDQLAGRIGAMMEPFRGFHDLICTIPGISTRTADVVVAETGADMSRFPTAKHLASRAGTTPGDNESAGRVKSSRTRPGNPYLQGPSGRQRCRSRERLVPTSMRGTGGSQPAADLRRPTLPSSMHSSGFDLAHRNHRHPLRGPRSRLLQPATSRASQTTCHPSTRSYGLPRHARPSFVERTAAVSLTRIFASACRAVGASVTG